MICDVGEKDEVYKYLYLIFVFWKEKKKLFLFWCYIKLIKYWIYRLQSIKNQKLKKKKKRI